MDTLRLTIEQIDNETGVVMSTTTHEYPNLPNSVANHVNVTFWRHLLNATEQLDAEKQQQLQAHATNVKPLIS